MRYEKPMVMDLSARAAGQIPLVCFSGNGPGGGGGCLGGTSPWYTSCGAGGEADYQACVGGSGASGTWDDCFSGSTPGSGGYCAAGGTPGAGSDSCTNGPTPS
jgi:hypothetical protein